MHPGPETETLRQQRARPVSTRGTTGEDGRSRVGSETHQSPVWVVSSPPDPPQCRPELGVEPGRDPGTSLVQGNHGVITVDVSHQCGGREDSDDSRLPWNGPSVVSLPNRSDGRNTVPEESRVSWGIGSELLNILSVSRTPSHIGVRLSPPSDRHPTTLTSRVRLMTGVLDWTVHVGGVGRVGTTSMKKE